MKYIFDFDDVIFHTTKHRKEHMFPLLEKSGIPKQQIDEYYQKTRVSGFSLRKMLAHFNRDGLYEEIMGNTDDHKNTISINVIKKLGKENCFLITHGGDDFQNEKITRTNVAPLFSKIIILVGSKKNAVEEICKQYKDEIVYFIDDKAIYFEDLNREKYPNLKTILYTGQDLEPYFQ